MGPERGIIETSNFDDVINNIQFIIELRTPNIISLACVLRLSPNYVKHCKLSVGITSEKTVIFFLN